MSDQNDDDPDHQVGYGKPPRETQFRKGKSGNPRGRPARIEPSRTKLQQQLDFLAVAEQLIPVTINGSRKSFSGFQLAVMKLQQKTHSGDKHAMSLYFELAKEFMVDFSTANPEATRMVEELHRARVMQPKPFSAEDIEFVNKLHKKTRG